MVDKVDIDKLPRMTIEQQDALCRPVIGMVRECEYSISPSGYAFWNGKEWQPYYQSRTKENIYYKRRELLDEDGSIKYTALVFHENPNEKEI